MSALLNIEVIVIRGSNITTIPWEAFKSVNSVKNKLIQLNIDFCNITQVANN
jgi:hypothetical protein